MRTSAETSSAATAAAKVTAAAAKVTAASAKVTSASATAAAVTSPRFRTKGQGCEANY
jgi:hypothetical protein